MPMFMNSAEKSCDITSSYYPECNKFLIPDSYVTEFIFYND